MPFVSPTCPQLTTFGFTKSKSRSRSENTWINQKKWKLPKPKSGILKIVYPQLLSSISLFFQRPSLWGTSSLLLRKACISSVRLRAHESLRKRLGRSSASSGRQTSTDFWGVNDDSPCILKNFGEIHDSPAKWMFDPMGLDNVRRMVLYSSDPTHRRTDLLSNLLQRFYKPR